MSEGGENQTASLTHSNNNQICMTLDYQKETK